MTDPNLEKIIENNIKDIEKDELGLTIAQASSYLNYIYKNQNLNKKKIELDSFVQKIKDLANYFKIKHMGD